jgi:hypothetical protein
VTTLEGGQNLGELSDVKYFQNNLYRALNVPMSRLESQSGFMIGRTSEITRDELKFSKFVDRLRSKFSFIFDELMMRQLTLKGICSPDEWNQMKEFIHYDFQKDNNFTELKEAELITSRIQLLNAIDPYVGKYYSMNWIRRHVLMMTEEDIEKMDEQLEEESEMMEEMQQQMVDQQDQQDQPQTKPKPKKKKE